MHEHALVPNIKNQVEQSAFERFIIDIVNPSCVSNTPTAPVAWKLAIGGAWTRLVGREIVLNTTVRPRKLKSL